MINKNISVVTVTFNDNEGLMKTLSSLSILKVLPREVIVVDGGSLGFDANGILEKFSNSLPQLIITSEPDLGIYDAMNKGKRKCLGALIHYLNSGDIVEGDPYHNLKVESLLPVKFLDEKGVECGNDRVKFFGTAYNHQGIIFNKYHSPFNINYQIASDYVSILQSFPEGLKNLPISKHGSVCYSLGGRSSNKSLYGSLEMVKALILYRPLIAIVMIPIIFIKLLIPRGIRRAFLQITKS